MERETRTYRPYFPLTTTEIELLEVLRDRNLGVVSVTSGNEFCGNSFFTEFEAFPEGKQLSLGINNTEDFRALDVITAHPVLEGEELINRTDFDPKQKSDSC